MDLQTAFLLIQALWGLVTVIGTFAIGRLVRDLDKNTKATEHISKSIDNLALSIAMNNVTKEEWLKSEGKLQALNDRVVMMETRQKMVEEGWHK